MSLSVVPRPRKRVVLTKSRRGLFKLIVIVSPTLVLLYLTLFQRLDGEPPQDAPPEAEPVRKRFAEALPKRTGAYVAGGGQDFTDELRKRTAPNAAPFKRHALVIGEEHLPEPPVAPVAPVKPVAQVKPVAVSAPAPHDAKAATGAPQVKASSFEPPSAPAAKKRFCDGATLASPCVFDIGLNSGQDTALYLRESNARVIAVEANPTLIEAAKHRFVGALSSNRLQLVPVGLTDMKPVPGAVHPTITFWVNTQNDKFGSFVEQLGCRTGAGKTVPAGDHTSCRRIEIPTRTCRDLVVQYGRPTYMKIDIEGMDRACFRSLGSLPLSERPGYLSVENVFAWDIDELVGLGYKRFKMVNQMVLEAKARGNPSMLGNSGPWGDKAVDQFLGVGWHTVEEAKKRLPLPPTITFPDGVTVKAWYDLHAAM